MVKRYFFIPLYLLVAVICGVILMFAVYLMPTARVKAHVKESARIYKNEGDYFNWIPGIASGRLDNFTDSIILREAIYEDDKSLVYNAMLNPHAINNEIESRTQQLLVALDDKKAEELGFKPSYYGRYWHGYLVVIKPLLQIMNVSELRLLNMLCVFSLLIISAWLLGRSIGLKYAAAYCLAVFTLNPVTIAMSFQYSTVYYVVVIETIASLLLHRRLEQENAWLKIFMLSGICTAFIDFLTYPVAAMGFLLVLRLLFEANREKGRKQFVKTIECSVVWCIGYLGMWLGKCLAASLIVHQNVLLDAWNRVEYRTGGNVGSESIGLLSEIFASIGKNVSNLLSLPNCLFFIFGMILVAALLILRKAAIKRSNPLVYFWIALYPFFWFAAVRNHSIVHSWMTFRVLSVTVFASACGIFSLLEKGEREHRE